LDSVWLGASGFAFIEYSHSDDAEYAIKQMNRKDLKGQEIRVEFAREGSCRAPSLPPLAPSFILLFPRCQAVRHVNVVEIPQALQNASTAIFSVSMNSLFQFGFASSDCIPHFQVTLLGYSCSSCFASFLFIGFF
jgi:RNA recognition motif-containing protein